MQYICNLFDLLVCLSLNFSSKGFVIRNIFCCFLKIFKVCLKFETAWLLLDAIILVLTLFQNSEGLIRVAVKECFGEEEN